MKQLVINFFSIALVIFIVLFLLQKIVDSGLRKSQSDLYKEWNQIYKSDINAEILLCGSSTTHVGISTRILDSILHLNTYNLAFNGYTFEMQLARLKIYLEHNIKPKYIIHGIDFAIFSRRKDLISREQFFPYLSDSIILSNTQQYEGKFTFAELYFPMYKFNNNISTLVEGVKSWFGKGSISNNYKGYAPNDNKWNGEELRKVKINNSNGLDYIVLEGTRKQFYEYVKYCNNNNIKLIFEYIPQYHEVLELINKKDLFLDSLKRFTLENNIPFLDYSRDSITFDTAYFYNGTHLNKKGSELFSFKFANDLKKFIH